VRCGAHGYLLKKIEPKALFDTLRGVHAARRQSSRMMAASSWGNQARYSQPGMATLLALRPGDSKPRRKAPGLRSASGRTSANICNEGTLVAPLGAACSAVVGGFYLEVLESARGAAADAFVNWLRAEAAHDAAWLKRPGSQRPQLPSAADPQATRSSAQHLSTAARTNGPSTAAIRRSG